MLGDSNFLLRRSYARQNNLWATNIKSAIELTNVIKIFQILEVIMICTVPFGGGCLQLQGQLAENQQVNFL